MPTIELDAKQRKALKAKAHHLKAVVTTGNAGLSDAVMAEMEIALAHHELIKVKLAGSERDERKQAAEAICEQLNAGLVQVIGQVVVIYRENPDK